MRVLLLMLLSVSLLRCQNGSSAGTSETIRAVLPFQINDTKYVGTATLSQAAAFKIRFEPGNNAHIAMATSCHREIVWRNPDNVIDFLYMPVALLESRGSCLLTLSVISKQGNLQQGLIEFTDSSTTLPARLQCNGRWMDASGSSLCQARSGTMQRIEFAGSEVVGIGDPGCPEVHQSGNAFEYRIASGLCVYAFSFNKLHHRLTTRGYTAIEKE